MTLYAKILAVLLALPVYREDIHEIEAKRRQLEIVARSISSAVGDETPRARSEAALLMASGWEESGWSLRVHAGRCKPDECDRGRARGPWQAQRNGMSAEAWDQMIGVENTDAQARVIVKRIAFYRSVCGGSTQGVIARYLGLPCRHRNEQIVGRWRAYVRMLAKLDSFK